MDASAISGVFGDSTPIVPAVITIAGALLMPALYYGLKRRGAVAAAATAAAIASLAVNAALLSGGYVGTYAGLFEYNAFSGLMMMLFQIVAAITLFVSSSSVETTVLHFGAFNALVLIAASGMMFVAMSTDLVALFVGVEAVSISSYVLVTMKRNDPRAAEAGVKYVVIGGMSTALTVYGISMIYGALGTLEFDELGAALAGAGYTWAFVIGLIATIAGYGFKIAAVPFHMWAPDVYEGASAPVSVLLATGSKKMGLVVFFKVFAVMFVGAKAVSGLGIEEVQYVFAIVAAFSMTVGNIVAIAQSNIKRMLAYSSIAQAGYILIAMAVMSEYALAGGMFHMFTHVFMKGGAFLIAGALVCAGAGEKISDYNGLAERAPFLAFAMLVFLFSLAGIPPLAGFTSKFVLFSGAIYGEDGVITRWIWLAFIAILNSAISLYYYVRVVKAMYVEKPNGGVPEGGIRIPKAFTIAIAACLAMVVVLGVCPDIILGPCGDAAAALLAGIRCAVRKPLTGPRAGAPHHVPQGPPGGTDRFSPPPPPRIQRRPPASLLLPARIAKTSIVGHPRRRAQGPCAAIRRSIIENADSRPIAPNQSSTIHWGLCSSQSEDKPLSSTDGNGSRAVIGFRIDIYYKIISTPKHYSDGQRGCVSKEGRGRRPSEDDVVESGRSRIPSRILHVRRRAPFGSHRPPQLLPPESGDGSCECEPSRSRVADVSLRLDGRSRVPPPPG